MQRIVEEAFFLLIRSEIAGTKLREDIKKTITNELLIALFNISKKHDVANLMCNALEKNGILCQNEKARQAFVKERNKCIYRYEQQKYELEHICQVFDQEKIPFIPLKGCIVRQYYPQPWMRTSCDIDILIKKEDLERAKESLIRELKYDAESAQSCHDISLYAPSGVHLELHYSLVEEEIGQISNEILETVWDYAQKSSSYQMHMTTDMFYFYHIAHMAKHFKIGGCGVRPFVDVYLMRKNDCFCFEQIDNLLERGGLSKFEQCVVETTNIWFGDGVESKISSSIKDYVLYAGMYGDLENRAAVRQAKTGGRFKFLMSRIFLPYEQLRLQYPKLEKRKYLMFVYQIKRWFRLLFGKKSRGVSCELRANMSVSSDKKQQVAELIKDLEL